MRRRFLAAVLMVSCCGATVAAAGVPGGLSPAQIQARLGIGDLRPLDGLNDTASLPVLADLLARAETGEYRQHSGGVRAALLEQMVRIDGAVETLGDAIEQQTVRNPEAAGLTAGSAGADRETLFDALTAIGGSGALRQMERFLFDGRTPRVAVGDERGGELRTNSFLAAQRMARLLGADSPVTQTGESFGPEEVRRVQEWWRAKQEAGVSTARAVP